MYLISNSIIFCYFSSFLCCRVFRISGWLDEHREADWGLIQVLLCLLKQVELWDSRSYTLYLTKHRVYLFISIVHTMQTCNIDIRLIDRCLDIFIEKLQIFCKYKELRCSDVCVDTSVLM